VAALGVVAVVVGLCGLAVYPAAKPVFDRGRAATAPEESMPATAAASDPAATTEIAVVTKEISAVLASAPTDAPAPQVADAVDRYLSTSSHSEKAKQGALAVLLEGEWGDSAALRNLYSRYSPDDVGPPVGGAGPMATLRAASVSAPHGGAVLTKASGSPRSGGGDPPAPPAPLPPSGDGKDGGGDPPAPPPLPPSGGGSDYRF
jgi:hypothetical protein